MKIIILIMLVCFLIPSIAFAQEEVNANSIEGTLWSANIMFVPLIPKYLLPRVLTIGFFDGSVYACRALVDEECTPAEAEDASYHDFSRFSIAYNFIGYDLFYAFMSSRDLGYIIASSPICGENILCGPHTGMGRLQKISDDWTP